MSILSTLAKRLKKSKPLKTAAEILGQLAVETAGDSLAKLVEQNNAVGLAFRIREKLKDPAAHDRTGTLDEIRALLKRAIVGDPK